MFDPFKKHINAKLSILNNAKLLIAVSGGIDSVVLVHLCHSLKLNIALAHCNFNLRGKESDVDEDFVLELADSLDLEVFIQSFETEVFAQDNTLSIQMAARKLRYDWFEALAKQLHFDYVLTAHHADDNLETFLINLTRGTGLEGLTGIPEINSIFVRPLLPFSREQIIGYALEHHINWREDKSNDSNKYVRNKIRQQVIPVLKEINPSLLQSFQNTIQHLQDSHDIATDSIAFLKNKKLLQKTPEGFKLPIAEIQKFKNPKAYLYQFLNIYGFTQWDDIANLLETQSGKQIFSESWRLIKDRDFLLLSKKESPEQILISILETDKKVETSIGTLFLSEVDAISETGKNILYLDKQSITFPLSLRNWEEGDVFQPIGMHGKTKKVSKYLKDEKKSLLQKEQLKVLCSGEFIIWLVGMRADHRFRVTSKTKRILKIELK